MTDVSEVLASPKPKIPQQERIGPVGDGALEPVIQSALGIVRESAGLLCHIAGLGFALVWDPKISRPKCSVGQARSAGPMSANVIPFPSTRNVKPPGQD